MIHYLDGSFCCKINGSELCGPTRDMFVVSHAIDNFAFTMGRKFYCFNGDKLKDLSCRREMRKVVHNGLIKLICNGVQYELCDGTFNWIDCHEFELLLLSNGYYLLFDRDGYLCCCSREWCDRMPIWLIGVCRQSI